MTRSSRTRRSISVLVATLIALTFAAGCGGSEVPEAASDSDVGQLSTATDPEARAGTAPGAGTDAAAPSAGDAGADAPALGTDSDAATKTDVGKAPAPGAGGEKRAKTSSPGKTGGATAGDTAAADGSAVQRLVATHPIFGGSGACKPATLSEVPLGNVSTFSGVLGELLSPVRPALETFVASQNACGGLNGHRIKLFFDDDQGDPSTAVTKIGNMIQNKKVLAFVGNTQVLTIDAVVPIIKRSGIPMIGGDITSNTWFENPLLFPQGTPVGAVSYGFLYGSTDYHKAKNVGDIWCIEVPRACEQIDRAYKELAPKLGATVTKSIQASITQPSYVQQCLEFKNAGVEAVALILDAASMNRMARSCEQVGYYPKVVPTPLGVGNEKQFLSGNTWLGNGYIPMQLFPWFGTETAAQKYWHASVKKYNPGFTQGGAASVGWSAGAMLVAAAAELSPDNPTTADLLKGLFAFQGQKFTELGGLTGPRTFREGATPKVPYCLFAGISNAANTGWAKSVNRAECTDIVAPSDPQLRG